MTLFIIGALIALVVSPMIISAREPIALESVFDDKVGFKKLLDFFLKNFATNISELSSTDLFNCSLATHPNGTFFCGSGINASGGGGGAGDNLGNHIATQDLNMSGFNVTEVNWLLGQSQEIELLEFNINPSRGDINCVNNGGSVTCLESEINQSDDIVAFQTGSGLRSLGWSLAQLSTVHNTTHIPRNTTIENVSLTIEWYATLTEPNGICGIEIYNGTWTNITNVCSQEHLTQEEIRTYPIKDLFTTHESLEDIRIIMNYTAANGFMKVDNSFINISLVPFDLNQTAQWINCTDNGGTGCTLADVQDSDSVYAQTTDSNGLRSLGFIPVQLHTIHNYTSIDYPNDSQISTFIWLNWSVTLDDTCSIEVWNGSWILVNSTCQTTIGAIPNLALYDVSDILHNNTLRENAEIRINYSAGNGYLRVDEVLILIDVVEGIPQGGRDLNIRAGEGTLGEPDGQVIVWSNLIVKGEINQTGGASQASSMLIQDMDIVDPVDTVYGLFVETQTEGAVDNIEAFIDGEIVSSNIINGTSFCATDSDICTDFSDLGSTPEQEAYRSMTIERNSLYQTEIELLKFGEYPGGLTYTDNVDPFGISFNSGTGNLTVNTSGIYQIEWKEVINVSSFDEVNLIVMKNGAPYYYHYMYVHVAVDPVERSVGLLMELEAYDNISLKVNNTDGVDLVSSWAGTTIYMLKYVGAGNMTLDKNGILNGSAALLDWVDVSNNLTTSQLYVERNTSITGNLTVESQTNLSGEFYGSRQLIAMTAKKVATTDNYLQFLGFNQCTATACFETLYDGSIRGFHILSSDRCGASCTAVVEVRINGVAQDSISVGGIGSEFSDAEAYDRYTYPFNAGDDISCYYDFSGILDAPSLAVGCAVEVQYDN